MSGLAEILLTMGGRVTGSDLKRSPVTDRLKRRGAKIYWGHRPENLGHPQVVVVTSALSKNNSEVAAAIKIGIPVISRGEMLAELMRLKYGIAVAGSHGKTTTTSLVASVLAAGNFDPTMVIGGRVKSLRSNARLGKGDFLVAEADESDGSFLHLNPTIAVVTNIDREHMDHYRDFETLRKSFDEFVSKIPFYGMALFCADHPETAALAARFTKRGRTYGIQEKADYQATHIQLKGWQSQFEVKYQGKTLGTIRLKVPGQHNVLNSLAAIAIGHELGMRFSDIRKGLTSFRGIGRRLEIVHDGKIRIVDDYGHHPEEIRATLAAIRKTHPKKLWVIFQPHRYTRTKDLFEDFVTAFEGVDHLIITDIYSAGEAPIHGVSGKKLAEAIRKKGDPAGRRSTVHFIPQVGDVAAWLQAQLTPGKPAPGKPAQEDLVLTLGAGDVWKCGRELASNIEP